MTFPWLEDASRHLDRCFFGDRRIHACLLTGPRMLGKVELGKRKAAALLCLETRDGAWGREACGQCRSCRLLAGGAHPDFQVLTFEFRPKPNDNELRTELVVEQVRELTGALSLTNMLSPCKVALIHPAEAMNRVAANALLKTLEEPPGNSVLILVASELARLPATVRSRCQIIQVRMPERVQARDWLAGNRNSDPGLAEAALAAAAGSPLLAEKLVADGSLDTYREVERSLSRVQSDGNAVGPALDDLSKSDPVLVWSWISLIAAQRLKRSITESSATAGGSENRSRAAGFGDDPGGIARLQSLADRNRSLMSTPVRKDLLLRDWLIQWARASMGEPRAGKT